MRPGIHPVYPPCSFPELMYQSHDTQPHIEGQPTNYTTLEPVVKSKTRVYTLKEETERPNSRSGSDSQSSSPSFCNTGFTPIHPAPQQQRGSLHSLISSGMITPVLAKQQHLINPGPLLSQHIGLTPPYAALGQTSLPPVQQQLTAPAPVHLKPPVPNSQLQQGAAPPHYAPISLLASLPQTLFFAAPVTGPALAVPSQLPSAQTVAPLGLGIPHPPLYRAPKPTIPDFSSDSEREFANLKLALDNLLEPHLELTEKYKYHVLLEHLKLPEAQMIGQSCRHHPYPYSAAMQALQLQYGQPHQLAQSEIAAILTSPDVKANDPHSFQNFSLRVHLLVSMLLSLEGTRGIKRNCCSHVGRLLSKLPKYLRDGFIESLQLQGKLNSVSLNPYNLQDFAGWLQSKAQQQRLLQSGWYSATNKRSLQAVGRRKLQLRTKVQPSTTVQSLQSPRYLAHPCSPNRRSRPRCIVFSVIAKSTILLAETALKNNQQRIWSNELQMESVAGNVLVLMHLRHVILRSPAVTVVAPTSKSSMG